jgi:hypothetical protein
MAWLLLRPNSIAPTPWGGKLQSSVFGSNLTAVSVLEGAFDSAVSTGVTSAVYGTDLKEGLKNGLVSSIVSLGLADAQAKIGDVFQGDASGGEGSLGHVLLHRLAGCAAAELQGAVCAAGAAGGISQGIYSGIAVLLHRMWVDGTEFRQEQLGSTA